MSVPDIEKARQLLSGFVGVQVSSVECDEFQLRLTFEDKSEFVTQSPWRLVLKNDLVFGSGDDVKKSGSEVLRGHLENLKVLSVAISEGGDSRLLFGGDRVLEVIANSVLYETWEAHLDAGWVVFALGGTTVFPIPASSPNHASVVRHR